MSSLLIKNIKTIYGLQTQSHPFKKGAAMSVTDYLDNSFIQVEKGKIVAFGPMNQAPEGREKIIYNLSINFSH